MYVDFRGRSRVLIIIPCFIYCSGGGGGGGVLFVLLLSGLRIFGSFQAEHTPLDYWNKNPPGFVVKIPCLKEKPERI